MASITLGGEPRTLRYGFLAFRKLAEQRIAFVPKMPEPEVLWSPETQIAILWAGLLADSPDVTIGQVQAWLDPMDFNAAYEMLAAALTALLTAWEGEQRRPPTMRLETSSVIVNAPPSGSATGPGSSTG